MSPLQRLRVFRWSFAAVGVLLVVGAVIAFARGELSYFGRTTGHLVVYSGFESIVAALAFLGTGVLLLARAFPRKRRPTVARLGFAALVVALVLQVFWGIAT